MCISRGEGTQELRSNVLSRPEESLPGKELRESQSTVNGLQLWITPRSPSNFDFPVFFLESLAAPQLNTRDLRRKCWATFFVGTSAPDEPTAPILRNVYARSPTATFGEPMLSSTGKPVARFDETSNEEQSFTIPDPRFARNVLTVNLPRKRFTRAKFMVGQPREPHLGPAFRKKSLRLLPSHVGGRVSKQKCVLVLVTLRKPCWIKEVERASPVDDFKTSRSMFGKSIPNLRDELR